MDPQNFFNPGIKEKPARVSPEAKVMELRPLEVCLKCLPIRENGGNTSWKSAKFISFNLMYQQYIDEAEMALVMADGSRWRIDGESLNIIKATLFPEVENSSLVEL